MVTALSERSEENLSLAESSYHTDKSVFALLSNATSGVCGNLDRYMAFSFAIHMLTPSGKPSGKIVTKADIYISQQNAENCLCQ